MSYGLFDADLGVYPYIPFFNLELMKIATYYKRKREIVVLSPTFSPNMYQHFIMRQDFPGENFPIMNYKNVECGGRAFNSLSYQPLDEQIEIMKPDTSIYNKVESNYTTSKYRHTAFKKMRKSEHLRLSLDGKTLWQNFEKQLKYQNLYVGVVFHDYDLNKIPNSIEAIQYILKQFKPYQEGQRIGMKFPVQVNTPDELFNWIQFKPMAKLYSIQYNGLMSNEVLKELMKRTEHTSKMIQMYYDISKNISYEEFVTKGVVHLYRQICFLRTHNIIFSLKYDENFFLDRRWLDVLDLMQRYWRAAASLPKASRAKILPYDSMYSFAYISMITPRKVDLTKQYLKELFAFVREQNYDLFKDFYEYRVSL